MDYKVENKSVEYALEPESQPMFGPLKPHVGRGPVKTHKERFYITLRPLLLVWPIFSP